MKRLALLILTVLLLPTEVVAETAAERSVLLVRQGAAALLRGRFDRAITAYDEALQYEKLAPVRKASILSDRGVAYWRMKKNDQALADFKQAIAINPQYPQAYNNFGNVMMDLNRHKDAIQAFSKAIELAPTYGAAYSNRGSAYFELGDIDKSIDDFSLAIRFLSLNAVPHNGRGRAFLTKNENYAALRDFTRAAKLNKTYGMVFLSRARAYANINAYRDAIKDYTVAISIAREEPQLYFERGQAYQSTDDYGPAIADYSKVIDLAPGHAEAYALRGLCYAFGRNYDKAMIDVEKAIELDPTSSAGYLARSKVLKRKGELDKALVDLNTVLEIVKEHSEALKLIGQIQEIREQNNLATTFYQRSLAADRFMDGSREGLKRLTGQLPSYAGEVVGEPVSGWMLSKTSGGRFYISNDNYPYLHAYLEVYGEGTPQLIEWVPMTGAWKGVGLLKYSAGTKGAGDQATPLVYSAIIDIKKAELAAIEPNNWGEKEAKWKWGNGSVTVTDPDGMVSEVFLREPMPETRTSSSGSAYTPSPWGDIWQPTRRSSRSARRDEQARQRRRRSQPKSLLDWLFQ